MKVYKINSDVMKDDDERVNEILQLLTHDDIIPEDHLYRGVNAGIKKLERILRTGTDRCKEEWEKSVQERYEEDEEVISMIRVRETTHPNRVWATDNGEIKEALESAYGEEPYAALLVYNAQSLRSLLKEFREPRLYEFTENPKKALKALFIGRSY